MWLKTTKAGGGASYPHKVTNRGQGFHVENSGPGCDQNKICNPRSFHGGAVALAEAVDHHHICAARLGCVKSRAQLGNLRGNHGGVSYRATPVLSFGGAGLRVKINNG